MIYKNFILDLDKRCNSQYPIETRQHILHEYRRFNNYWNLRWNTLAYFTLFLEFNSSAFSFGESIT